MRKLCVILLAVVMSVMMVVPAFAHDYAGHDGPSFDTVDDSYLSQYPYAHVTLDGQSLMMILTSAPLYNFNDYRFQLPNEDFLKGVWMKLSDDGTTWVYSSNVGGAYLKKEYYDIFWTNYDLYYMDGTLYLKGWTPPKILAEEIIDLAGDTIHGDTVPSISSAMTILCVTGVGLLAMLVLLKLFGKRSLIHR